MSSSRSLEGLRVAVLAADGFEQIELTHPVRRLRKEGADVRVISLRPGRIKGMNLMWGGKKIHVDETLFSAQPQRYDALLLPGGFINPDLLRQSERAREFVREFDRTGKPIAVICHGPWTLVSAGLVQGRKLTSWPGISDDVRNAGGEWIDQAVVRDNNWVSSRGPQDLRAFNQAMVSLFQDRAPMRTTSRPRQPRRKLAARIAAAAALTGAAVATVRRLAA